MNTFKNIIVLLLLLFTSRQSMAQANHKRYFFTDDASFGAYEPGTQHIVVSKSRFNLSYIFIKKSQRDHAKQVVFTSTERSTVINRTKEDLLQKLIRSNLKLSFRVSKTFNLSISYL